MSTIRWFYSDDKRLPGMPKNGEWKHGAFRLADYYRWCVDKREGLAHPEQTPSYNAVAVWATEVYKWIDLFDWQKEVTMIDVDVWGWTYGQLGYRVEAYLTSDRGKDCFAVSRYTCDRGWRVEREEEWREKYNLSPYDLYVYGSVRDFSFRFSKDTPVSSIQSMYHNFLSRLEVEKGQCVELGWVRP